jgi:hypothetical protein
VVTTPEFKKMEQSESKQFDMLIEKNKTLRYAISEIRDDVHTIKTIMVIYFTLFLISVILTIFTTIATLSALSYFS